MMATATIRDLDGKEVVIQRVDEISLHVGTPGRCVMHMERLTSGGTFDFHWGTFHAYLLVRRKGDWVNIMDRGPNHEH